MEKHVSHQTAFFSIFANLALAGVKISAGVLGNSYALIADGIESVSDVFSSFLVFFRAKICRKTSRCESPLRTWEDRAFGYLYHRSSACGLSPIDCLSELSKYTDPPL